MARSVGWTELLPRDLRQPLEQRETVRLVRAGRAQGLGKRPPTRLRKLPVARAGEHRDAHAAAHRAEERTGETGLADPLLADEQRQPGGALQHLLPTTG
jgi:hypothetical protein